MSANIYQTTDVGGLGVSRVAGLAYAVDGANIGALIRIGALDD